MYIVYKHTNLLNNKAYIGITKYEDNPNYRWKNGMGYVKNNKFFSEILQYGWNNFSHEILETGLNETEALKKETYYIKLYNTVNDGYNNSYGSGILSPESIEQIRQSLTGITRKPESIQKQLKTKQERYGSGRGLNFFGSQAKKVKCNETGDVFASAAEAGRWCGSNKVSASCNKIRKHAGKHPITKEPLSWSYAEPSAIVTIECNYDIQERRTIQKVQCVETKQIFENATEAEKATGVSRCNILRVCKGQRKTAGKLHWQYYI